MQQATAFAPPAQVTPAAVPRPLNPWILSSWRDLLLYVGTPLVILPLFALAQMRWSAQDIYLFVAAFGAMGHHLPGMMRAYGDRALFERFRWRFIVAPVFLVGVCIAFFWWDMKGITLIAFLWGVWHGLMQTYGFCRIYDAKMGSFAALSRRLDFATCVIWFGAAVVLSPLRMGDTLDIFYSCGGPFIPAVAVRMLQSAAVIAAGAVTVLFLGNFLWMWRLGKRANPVKAVLLASSIAFWWKCNNGVENILVGIALFEVFHDVQYLSIVWIYNRNRVEKDASIGGFMRFVFRRSGSLIGVYVGLVFAYGSLSLFNANLHVEVVKRILTGVVTASALLHFYYDGFIWKVRENGTRQSLGLTGGAAETASRSWLPSWLVHGLKWAAVFVLPVAALWYWQARGPVSEIERQGWVVDDLPGAARPHYRYALSLHSEGRLEEAAGHYEAALRLKPKSAPAHYNLGSLRAEQGRADDAIGHYRAALSLDPHDFGSQYNWGNVLLREQKFDEAEQHFRAALQIEPDQPMPHNNLGSIYLQQGRLTLAILEFKEALRIRPNFPDAARNLADARVAEAEALAPPAALP